MCVCVSKRKSSKVVNRCAYKGDREGVHMGDIVVQPNVRVFLRQRVRQAEGGWGGGEGESRPEMTKGLKGGEERWRDNG